MTGTLSNRAALAIVLGALALAGCSNTKAIPQRLYTGTPLDAHPIGVRETTQFLEIRLDHPDAQLRLQDRDRLRAFMRDYTRRGHGPLVMSMPENGRDPELAIQAVVEARAIAFEQGVDYQEIAGGVYDADNDGGAPLIVAFKTFETIAPDCPPLSEIDLSDVRTNSESPSFGCSINVNIAAMIAEPGDLLGERVLAEGDSARRRVVLELYREGAPTSAQRNDAESGAVSQAVN